MYQYIVALTSTDAIIDIPPTSLFTPTKLITNVDRIGQGAVTDLFFNGNPQLLGSIDAWLLSSKYEQERITAFLKEHGLMDKTADEVDDYLEENELTLPSSMRLNLPSIRSGTRVRVSTNGDFQVALSGWTDRSV